ncbi:MAG TPA: hypothetical protein VGI29_00695 [Candidatus Binataceae bacterium]
MARWRGGRLMQGRGSEALPGEAARQSIVAVGASRLRQLPVYQRSQLASAVGQGATLYVRGTAPGADKLDLAPFAPLDAPIAPERRAVGYRFAENPMLPAALRGEEATGGLLDSPGVESGFIPGAEELLVVRHVDGVKRAAIFALQYGDGCVIHDLNPEDATGVDAPIVARLAARETRPQFAGALLAVNRAAGIDPESLPPFNLTIDDRPANYDHFNTVPVSALLGHIERLCPGAHTDFAWTPRHTRPSRSYLEAMKQFSIGFAWHGLYRHVDHRVIADPAADLARGQRTVGRIERRFGIRFQPIMIFPFERAAPGHFPMLARAGFVASVEEPRLASCADPHFSASSDDSRAARVDAASGFVVLHRYPAVSLTRDRMLAMAVLGLPIIALAHPEDVGLRRFSRFWDRGGDPSHFDEVLKFASSKRMPSRSLYDIAAQVIAAESPRATPANSAQNYATQPTGRS